MPPIKGVGPPWTPLIWGKTFEPLSEKGKSKLKEYKTCPTFSHLLLSLHMEGTRSLLNYQSKAKISIVSLSQENLLVLKFFFNESAIFSNVSTFYSNTFLLSTMSLTK